MHVMVYRIKIVIKVIEIMLVCNPGAVTAQGTFSSLFPSPFT